MSRVCSNVNRQRNRNLLQLTSSGLTDVYENVKCCPAWKRWVPLVLRKKICHIVRSRSDSRKFHICRLCHHGVLCHRCLNVRVTTVASKILQPSELKLCGVYSHVTRRDDQARNSQLTHVVHAFSLSPRHQRRQFDAVSRVATFQGRLVLVWSASRRPQGE